MRTFFSRSLFFYYLGFIFSIFFVSVSVQAETPATSSNIVMVRIQQLYLQSEAIDDIRTRINTSFVEREQELTERISTLQQNQEQLQKNSLALDQQAKLSARYEIELLERDITRRRQALQEDRNLIFMQKRQIIDELISDIIAEIAQVRGFDFVIFEDSVLYAHSRNDISADVLIELDKRLPEFNL